MRLLFAPVALVAFSGLSALSLWICYTVDNWMSPAGTFRVGSYSLSAELLTLTGVTFASVGGVFAGIVLVKYPASPWCRCAITCGIVLNVLLASSPLLVDLQTRREHERLLATLSQHRRSYALTSWDFSWEHMLNARSDPLFSTMEQHLASRRASQLVIDDLANSSNDTRTLCDLQMAIILVEWHGRNPTVIRLKGSGLKDAIRQGRFDRVSASHPELNVPGLLRRIVDLSS